MVLPTRQLVLSLVFLCVALSLTLIPFPLPSSNPMASKSKILFIGGTGYIGKFIVAASAKAGHETFALVRDATLSNPAKSQTIDNFKSLGVKFVIGDLYDKESLDKAVKQVDVVISTVGHGQLADQGLIIAAIKEAGNVKVLNPF